MLFIFVLVFVLPLFLDPTLAAWGSLCKGRDEGGLGFRFDEAILSIFNGETAGQVFCSSCILVGTSHPT